MFGSIHFRHLGILLFCAYSQAVMVLTFDIDVFMFTYLDTVQIW